MTIMQTIDQEIAKAVAGNELYDRYLDRWRFLLEAYLGGAEWRSGGHLTRYALESDAEYQSRLRATPYENQVKSVCSVYTSFLFREEPERDFGQQTGTPELEDFLKDADFEGRSLNAFMKDVATWSAVFGHTWILMAKPDVGAATLAEEQALGVRPYVVLLNPMTCLDWKWDRDVSGRYQLSYFKYVEDINGDIRTIKEWTPETITTKIVDLKARTIAPDEVVANGLGMIPAVICYNNRSTVRGIGISAVSDIADACKFIYNATSEVDQSIRLDSHPSLVVTPETQIGVGAGALIKIPENMDSGLKPYVLDFSGANVSSIYEAINHTIESIDKMANTGGVRATESRTMSGIAMETEFQLLNARLSEMADALELAEEQMWRIWSMYQGYSYDMTIEYPGSFNIKDNKNEIMQLGSAKSAATDPRVLAAIDVKILDWLDLDEDELAALNNPTIINPDLLPEQEDAYVFNEHVMVNPLTGEEVIATTQQQHIELANQGYYHKD